jgi:hypothetical protein
MIGTVVLKKDISEAGLQTGDVGAIVHRHSDGSAYEVEFVAADGRTIALLTLSAADIRPMRGGEILHVRELAGT